MGYFYAFHTKIRISVPIAPKYKKRVRNMLTTYVLKKVSRVTDLAFNALVVVSVIMLISLAVTKITTGRESIFGYRPLYCVSESMEPTIRKGDWVLGRVADRNNLKRGKIYTYDSVDYGITVMHRLDQINGDKTLTFKGDNNEKTDAERVKPPQIGYEVVLYRN